MKKGKADKLGLVRISENETCFDIPVYIAKNGAVTVRSSSRKGLQTKQDRIEASGNKELGEGWTILKGFVRLNIESGEVEFDRLED